MKQCFKCLEVKELRQFYTHKGMSDGHLNKCIVCSREDSKKNFKTTDKIKLKETKRLYRKRTSKKHLNWRLQKMYGITLDQYNQMLIEQDHKCAVCSKTGSLVVDHCHKTNKVRGLLHRTCNSALGLLQEDPEILLKAASYVAMAGF